MIKKSQWKKTYKKLKKNVKKHKNFSFYKKTFRHSATRYVLSYIVSYLLLQNKKSVDLDIVVALEYQLTIINKKTLNNFKQTFAKLKIFSSGRYKKIRWEGLGAYFYFQWQASRYKYDSLHKIPNIFLMENVIELNSKKRKCFYDWVDSISQQLPAFNELILFLRQKGI